uniref:Latartoxin-2c n=1 Tax=Lachesana tarabaevi TaxID=379576 RepID=LTX2C_LACTA|nr:RecName: Full=Latartoxin-2c; Short=LtTx-2c; Flags: Precursor [Lachesana tarabaevi]AFX65332.1 precursor toxin Tx 2c [Lachesana tarabaevi]
MKVLVITALCFILLQNVLGEDTYEDLQNYIENLINENQDEARECVPLENDCTKLKYSNPCCKDEKKKYQYKCSCIVDKTEQCTCQRKETVEKMMKGMKYIKNLGKKIG